MTHEAFTYESAFFAHAGGAMSICFSRDGACFLTSGYDSKTRIWNVFGREIEWYEGLYRGVSAFVNDDKHIFIGGLGRPYIYDRNSRLRLYSPRRLSNIWAIAVDHAHERIAIANHSAVDDENGVRPLQIRSTRSWRICETLKFSLVRPDSFIDIVGLSYTSNGKYLAIATSPDSLVRIWSFDQNAVTKKFKPALSSSFACSFSVDGSLLITGGRDLTVRLWRFEHLTLVAELPLPAIIDERYTPEKDFSDCIISSAWSPDGRYIAVGTLSGYICLWKTSDKK